MNQIISKPTDIALYMGVYNNLINKLMINFPYNVDDFQEKLDFIKYIFINNRYRILMNKNLLIRHSNKET